MGHEIYQATGPGSENLPYPILAYILTSEPFLGTAREGVPDGPFNRELHKLLKNDEAICALIDGYLKRTFGVISDNAPAVGVIPDPLVGAPVTPADKAQHSIYFLDYEVIYVYNGTDGLWEEGARQQRSVHIYKRHTATLTVPLGDGAANVALVLPTVDDAAEEFEFALSDIKNMYVDDLSATSPVIGVTLGMDGVNPVLRPLMTEAPEPGSEYNAILTFERLVQLA